MGVWDYGVDGSSHVVSPEKGKAPGISEGLPLASKKGCREKRLRIR